jgi:UDP-GlcNAc:undecaprenyl-phosphate GlcNAc-1-phosphate transferase
MQIPVTAIILALVAALLVTPLVGKWAFKCGALDRPGQRKIHNRVMPRMGGVAIYISFVVAVLLTREITLPVAGFLAGGFLIVLLGIIDDTRGVSPWVKLAGQVVAAGAVIPFGIKVQFLTNPFSHDLLALGVLSIPVTVIWMVAVINAVNLVDGLDGLAGGTSCIAVLTLAAVIWIEILLNGGATQGQWDAITLALVLAAAILGFLRYNFHPAKIFLGDSGSMYLGYSVAVLAVMGLAKSATFISVIIPVVILGIPFLDTTLAIIRRYCGNRPIFQADQGHLHHRLIAMGFSHRRAVLCLYGVNIVLALSAVVMTLITPKQAVVFLVLLSTGVLVLVNKTGIVSAGGSGHTGYLARSEKQQRSS